MIMYLDFLIVKKRCYIWFLKGKFVKDGKFLVYWMVINNNLVEYLYIVFWLGEYKKVLL